MLEPLSENPFTFRSLGPEVGGGGVWYLLIKFFIFWQFTPLQPQAMALRIELLQIKQYRGKNEIDKSLGANEQE